jgi:tetratricopeptide (TPR) repeat protein
LAQATDHDAEAHRLWTESHEAFRRRDYARTAELLQTLLAGPGGIDPATIRQQLGITLLRLKRTEEGVRELQHSVELDPGVGRAHYKLGLGLARLSRNDEALASFERAVALAPDTADHQWRLGEELRRRGRRPEALAAVRRSLELQPGHDEALASLAKLQRGGWLAGLARWLKRR